MEYKITQEESDKIENLFYSYQALANLLKVLSPGTELYEDILARYQDLNVTLEREKRLLVDKYIGKFNIDYIFNFSNNSIVTPDEQ